MCHDLHIYSTIKLIVSADPEILEVYRKRGYYISDAFMFEKYTLEKLSITESTLFSYENGIKELKDIISFLRKTKIQDGAKKMVKHYIFSDLCKIFKISKGLCSVEYKGDQSHRFDYNEKSSSHSFLLKNSILNDIEDVHNLVLFALDSHLTMMNIRLETCRLLIQSKASEILNAGQEISVSDMIIRRTKKSYLVNCMTLGFGRGKNEKTFELYDHVEILIDEGVVNYFFHSASDRFFKRPPFGINQWEHEELKKFLKEVTFEQLTILLESKMKSDKNI
jgi:hypothetical protein